MSNNSISRKTDKKVCETRSNDTGKEALTGAREG